MKKCIHKALLSLVLIANPAFAQELGDFRTPSNINFVETQDTTDKLPRTDSNQYKFQMVSNRVYEQDYREQINKLFADERPSEDLLVMIPKNSERFKFVTSLDGKKKTLSEASLRKLSVETIYKCILEEYESPAKVPQSVIYEVINAVIRDYLLNIGAPQTLKVKPLRGERAPKDVPINAGCVTNLYNWGVNYSVLSHQADLVVVSRKSLPRFSEVQVHQRTGSIPFQQAYEVLFIIPQSLLLTRANNIEQARENRDQEARNRLENLKALANDETRDEVGSLAFRLPDKRSKDPVRFCTLRYRGEEGAAVLGYRLRGFATQDIEWREYAKKENIKDNLDTRRLFAFAYNTLEELWADRQNFQDISKHCHIYVDFPANLNKIIAAHERADFRYGKIGELISSDVLRNDWAKNNGFESYVSYSSARQMKASPQQFKELLGYNIKDKESFDSVVREMQQRGYSTNNDASEVIQFLKDKSTASEKPGTTASSIRDQRLEQEKAAQKKRQDEYAKKYPFIAILTCGLGRHANIYICFAGGKNRVDTELKLRNGGLSRVYKVFNLGDAGQERDDGFHIDLENSFELQVQNAHEHAVLGLKIINRTSGRTVFQDQAGHFGVIRARN